MNILKRKKFYTTSEVAGILNVAVGSIINWVDSHEINAVVTPGGHRKIPFKDLIFFLESHNYEIPPELLVLKDVFLVDDDKKTHDLFNEMFKSIKGYNLKVFYSGTEVLLAMGKEPPKIIIVDVLMPDFDGIQVIKNIKNNNRLKNVHIIAISGDSSKKQSSLDAGANVFLAKPIIFKEMKSAILEVEKKNLKT